MFQQPKYKLQIERYLSPQFGLCGASGFQPNALISGIDPGQHEALTLRRESLPVICSSLSVLTAVICIWLCGFPLEFEASFTAQKRCAVVDMVLVTVAGMAGLELADEKK